MTATTNFSAQELLPHVHTFHIGSLRTKPGRLPPLRGWVGLVLAALAAVSAPWHSLTDIALRCSGALPPRAVGLPHRPPAVEACILSGFQPVCSALHGGDGTRVGGTL